MTRQATTRDIQVPEAMLTLAQVCEVLAVHPNTLREWRLKGVAPRFVRLPNGQLRSRRDWLEDWLVAREMGGAA